MQRKANLKLTIQRLKLQKQKRGNLADNEKRVIADFLAKGKDDEARIRVEGILKEEAVCEAYEILGHRRCIMFVHALVVVTSVQSYSASYWCRAFK
jgi:hypothetical protein